MLHAKVTPFRALIDDADCVAVSACTSFGPPPTFSVIIGKYHPAVPASERIASKPGVDTPDNQPIRSGVQERIETHITVDVTLTKAQWNAWGASIFDDDVYILGCVIANLKLKLV